MLVLFAISGIFIYDARIETVVFDKRINWAHKSKFRCCSSKKKENGFALTDIVTVNAAKRGYVLQGMDTTHFVLVLTLKNGMKVTILETKNVLKIKRKVFDSLL
jgi:hypothetical protein